MGEPITPDEMKLCFKKFDQNGDGFITKDELDLAMKTYGSRTYTKKEIEDMIAAADKDADGKISYEGTARDNNYTQKQKLAFLNNFYASFSGKIWLQMRPRVPSTYDLRINLGCVYTGPFPNGSKWIHRSENWT